MLENEKINDIPKNPNIKSGKSKAPDTGEPGSVYEQIDDLGELKSRTTYGENGKIKYRDDYKGRAHYDKKTKKYLLPYRHTYRYNNLGQPIGQEIGPVP